MPGALVTPISHAVRVLILALGPIPAGVAHCNRGESPDFRVVGAYPEGQGWDMRRGSPEELTKVLTNIRNVALPECDPFYGAEGPLMQFWR